MKNLITLIGLVFLASCGNTPTDSQKKETIETILKEYEECVANAESNKDCKCFTAQAICEYNGITDFKKGDDFIEYHEIYDYVSNSSDWTDIGEATSADVLKQAQEMTNKGYPVIAIKTTDKHKYAVMIIKGETKKSGKWGAEVPACAAFFPVSSGLESFIHKHVNYAWSSPKGVRFFAKK